MLEQEVILTLREERDQAKARADVEQQRIEAIQEELNEAIGDHSYWYTRAQALDTLLAQDAPPAPPAFATFGDGGAQ